MKMSKKRIITIVICIILGFTIFTKRRRELFINTFMGRYNQIMNEE